MVSVASKSATHSRDRGAHARGPDAWKPDYSTWAREFERYDVTPKTMLVGHSCGAGFLVRWLSQHTEVLVDRVLLVAPWLDPDREEAADFFDFVIDPGLAGRTSNLTILNSDDDDEDIQQSVRMIRDSVIGAHYREFRKLRPLLCERPRKLRVSRIAGGCPATARNASWRSRCVIAGLAGSAG